MNTSTTAPSPTGKLPGLAFMREGGTVLASFDPTRGPALADAAEGPEAIAAALADAGFSACRPKEAAIPVLAQALATGQAIAALPVADAVDGEVVITLAEDRMSAWLGIRPPQGGRPADEAAIRRALSERSVVCGLKDEVIHLAAALAETGTREALVVAEGRPAVAGEDGRFESLLPGLRSRVPQIDASGRVDYRNLGEVQTVQPGAPLMRRIHATAGVAGETVTGLAIPAKPGKEMMFAPNLDGVAVDPHDPDILTSTIVGQPVEVRGGVMVEPTHRVRAVNMATGNIIFDGSVVVEGDVQAGMTIKAGGDIEIGGTVEAVTLEAGGNIMIKGGVLGALGRPESEGGNRRISCQGSLTATFVQQAAIEAGDTILIDDVALQCQLVAGQRILVGDKKRGLLAGGAARAGLLVQAKVLGSPSHAETRIEVGVPQAVLHERASIARSREEKARQLDQLVQLLALGQKQPERLPPGFAEKAGPTRLRLLDELAELTARDQLLQRQVDLAADAKVVAASDAHEGVEIHLAGQIYRIKGERGHGGVFALDKGTLSWQFAVPGG